MSDETWTVGRLLQWTTEFLKQRGSPSPRLDAEVLLAKARGCQRIELYTAFNDVADEQLRTSFRTLVKQRADGTPVAYLVGAKEFFSLELAVTKDVLIPRPETELVVMAVIDLAKRAADPSEPFRIADVGTGSGAIAIAVAKHVPNALVTAIDISPSALNVAKLNSDRHQVSDRVQFLAGNLLADLPADAMFDVIASNPPYVSDSELETIAKQVAEFEPRLALAGGPMGTDIIQRLVAEAPSRLVSGGSLIMEISPMIESQVTDLLRSSGAFTQVAVGKDLAGAPRVVSAVKSL